MRQPKHVLIRIGILSAATLGITALVDAAPTIDGTLDTGAGYVLSSTQTDVTASPNDGGNPEGPSDEVTTPTSGSYLTQLSNAYTYLDTSTNTLDLFVGGSLNPNDQGVSHYEIALQTTTAGGVSGLAGIPINGSVYLQNNPGNTTGDINPNNNGLEDITFAGFKPNALFLVQPSSGAAGEHDGGAAYTGFTDLTGGGATDTPTIAYNGALQNTTVGVSGSGTTFSGASTGLEIAIPLTPLGYTGGNILASVFTTNGGADGRTTNQVLSPINYPANAESNYGYDYDYIDSHEGSSAGRQFSGPGYNYTIGQFFTISVPEPTTVGLLALGGLAMLRRRSVEA